MDHKIQMSRKKALLVGMNYIRNIKIKKLRGCINDVWRMKECLLETFGFLEEDIYVLIDSDPAYVMPTASNIRSALESLVGSTKPGDVLFFHFSGHGGRMRVVPENSNHTGFVEFIVCADGNRITDNDFSRLVGKVPMGCSFTMLADCCHSGGLIKGAKEQIGVSTMKQCQISCPDSELDDFSGHYSYVSNRANFGLDRSQFEGHELKSTIGSSGNSLRCGGSILLSACQRHEVAKEVSFSENPNEVNGIFTDAILSTIEETKGQVTNWDLVMKAHKKLKRQGFSQTPGLYCSDHDAHASFLCVDRVDTWRVNKYLLGWMVFLTPIFVWLSRYYQRDKEN